MDTRVICGVACAGILAVILGLTIRSHVRDAKSGKPEISVSQPIQGPSETGLASFYDTSQKTASGEQFNATDLTAAHKTLRFGSRARVTNIESGKSVSVRINDRGPYAGGRIIDLSKKAAQTIGIEEKGVARVEVTPEGR
ncbi:MAG: septal ring lytic transglycosylase RlpA family protein [Rhodomicrobium sp.]